MNLSYWKKKSFFAVAEGPSHDGPSRRRLGHPGTLFDEARSLPGEGSQSREHPDTSSPHKRQQQAQQQLPTHTRQVPQQSSRDTRVTLGSLSSLLHLNASPIHPPTYKRRIHSTHTNVSYPAPTHIRPHHLIKLHALPCKIHYLVPIPYLSAKTTLF